MSIVHYRDLTSAPVRSAGQIPVVDNADPCLASPHTSTGDPLKQLQITTKCKEKQQ